MKSNRMFYIGLGCLFSTLCWTIVMVAKDDRNLSTLQVDHLICNDIRVLDRDGREAIKISERGGLGHVIRIYDNRRLKNGELSKAYLSLGKNKIVLFNAKHEAVVGFSSSNDYGLLWATNQDGRKHWEVNTGAPSLSMPPLK